MDKQNIVSVLQDEFDDYYAVQIIKKTTCYTIFHYEMTFIVNKNKAAPCSMRYIPIWMKLNNNRFQNIRTQNTINKG